MSLDWSNGLKSCLLLQERVLLILLHLPQQRVISIKLTRLTLAFWRTIVKHYFERLTSTIRTACDRTRRGYYWKLKIDTTIKRKQTPRVTTALSFQCWTCNEFLSFLDSFWKFLVIASTLEISTYEANKILEYPKSDRLPCSESSSRISAIELFWSFPLSAILCCYVYDSFLKLPQSANLFFCNASSQSKYCTLVFSARATFTSSWHNNKHFPASPL